jgi:hypothetical protein
VVLKEGAALNWLTDFFYTDRESVDEAVEPARRKRLETFRHALKVRRSRAKSSWKKIPKRFRRPAAAGLAIVVLGLMSCVAWWCFAAKSVRHDSSLSSLFPAPSAPILPALEDESMATDPKAAPRHWKWIVVHHSGGNSGSAQSFDTYHREIRGWQSLGYHFVIGNGKGQGDGKVAPGPRWYEQQAGAHAHSTEHNEFGIGICLVGNFDIQNPTPAQWHSLVDLVKRLSARYGIQPGNIVGHSQIRQGGSTACPGKNLNVQALREAVMGETR